ncbi:MAG: SAM-dependent methyltransferase [Acidimicrobiia bacterium]
MSVADTLRDRIHREGPIRFDAAMELLLYGEGGFFASGAGAGRRADFLTSPEVGPLFGAVVANRLDAEWERLGRPDPFVVVEAGAGRGALAAAVLGAGPACGPALRYLCVERSARLRERLAADLPVEPPATVLGPVVAGADGDEDDVEVGDDDGRSGPAPSPGVGPLVAVLDDLPLVPIVGVILANELLDNLPIRLLERGPQGWLEVFVGTEGEVLVGAPADLAGEVDRLAPDATVGARIPVQHEALAWVRRAAGTLRRGRLVVVDYADVTPSLAARPWTDWLRTYRGHARGGLPTEHPGDQDITCEVAVDQLVRWRAPDTDVTQADWLRAHGVDALADAARDTWRARAHLGDLEAMKARSRVSEADALTDESGLGAFRVLEWVVG